MLLQGDECHLSPKALDTSFYAVNPHTFGNYRAGYMTLWSRMTVTKVSEASKQVRLVVAHQDVYKDIEAATGVPWAAIAMLHLREAGPQDVGRWECTLHNGERIIGKGTKTKLVPKGVGPFKTFKEAAIHAIRQEGLDKIDWAKDGIAYLAFASETFNGFGYRNKGIPSPYLWGGSSVQMKGKYVKDGVFDRNTMDPQIGTMPLLKVLMDTTGYTFGKTPTAPLAAPKPTTDATPSPSVASGVDPQRGIASILGVFYSVIQTVLKRKS
jgi:lysozyme family protein